MKEFTSILMHLSGKKGVIATILGTLNGYLVAQGFIDQNTFLLIGGILGAIFGGVSYATKVAFKYKESINSKINKK